MQKITRKLTDRSVAIGEEFRRRMDRTLDINQDFDLIWLAFEVKKLKIDPYQPALQKECVLLAIEGSRGTR